MITTIEDIINGIAEKLEEIFGFPIYIEEVEQDMEEPCFFITLLSGSSEKGLSNTYTESLLFDVHYLNDLQSRDKNLDILQVEQKLLREIEYIPLEEGRLLQLRTKRTEKINDILHFFFDIDLRFMKVKTGVKMQDLQKEGVIKDE